MRPVHLTLVDSFSSPTRAFAGNTIGRETVREGMSGPLHVAAVRERDVTRTTTFF